MNIESVSNFLSNYIFPNVLAFCIGAFFSYLPARYNATKPMKLDVKRRQFENVYLPIYKLIQNDIGKSINFKTAKVYSTAINSIVQNNIELTYLPLINLNKKFYNAVHIEKNIKIKAWQCHTSFVELSKNIEFEYLLLKKSLGYPSFSNWEAFLRRSTFEKAWIILSNSGLMILTLIFIFSGIMNFLTGRSIGVIFLAFFEGLVFLALFIVNISRRD
ncbi:hypothetical protein EUCA11A_10530 [Eubacterium callanderi]|uniref:hypothetical protein n=1 Tax=Eubacterium callanderi TaxID=53442 RepID=UPI0029FF2518|nr:hypothetical protein [Eubacterium callanderi]WPK66900.1 hypothetical protein EUCA2A_10530 [Eubacterium callanderi]WPK71198.1 hypothetical protein EUCA11A_10530 [Eubacterium callanderi]